MYIDTDTYRGWMNIMSNHPTLPPDVPKRNVYGTLYHRDDKGQDTVVICGHGGSMWLCEECKQDILAKES